MGSALACLSSACSSAASKLLERHHASRAPGALGPRSTSSKLSAASIPGHAFLLTCRPLSCSPMLHLPCTSLQAFGKAWCCIYTRFMPMWYAFELMWSRGLPTSQRGTSRFSMPLANPWITCWHGRLNDPDRIACTSKACQQTMGRWPDTSATKGAARADGLVHCKRAVSALRRTVRASQDAVLRLQLCGVQR